MSNQKWLQEDVAPSAHALLTRMIAHGPRQYPFSVDELKDLLRNGSKVFLQEPSLLEVCSLLPSLFYHHDAFLFRLVTKNVRKTPVVKDNLLKCAEI
ncbi:unnamed protein product [Toxocara canis]|uniref:Uncharacterized protein n=1 Tax=Toxocara canis TaxID=6265 RepID=A0A3P7F4W4_TOXCA|nr:unnamed protein product [Toxocara canis]